MEKKAFNDKFTFIPYKSVGNLNFNESKENIESKLGTIKQEFDNYDDSGKTIIFNNLDNISVYLDNKNNLYGIHFFESIRFTLKDKLYDINYDNFNENNLKEISNDFKITNTEEGTDYTSEKLGLDFYFNEDSKLEAILFMSKEYYKKEI